MKNLNKNFVEKRFIVRIGSYLEARVGFEQDALGLEYGQMDFKSNNK